MNDFTAPEEEMVNEGGAISQPSTLPPGSVPFKERSEAALMRARSEVKKAVKKHYDPHPFRTLAVAFSVGVLLGVAIGQD